MNDEHNTFSIKHLNVIKEGIRLYNIGEYWNCHEYLEEHWLLERPNDVRYVYWAVIQAAACLIHYEKSNNVGAHNLIEKAKHKLQYLEELNIESDLLKNKLDWPTFKRLVLSIPNDCKLEDFSDLYKFKFPKVYEDSNEKFNN